MGPQELNNVCINWPVNNEKGIFLGGKYGKGILLDPLAIKSKLN